MVVKKSQAEKKIDKQTEDWMQKKWRPMMAMMYMCVCTFDFIIAPVLWAIVQFWETQAANDAFRQWQPLTLQGAGLFHMAMGAVLGITAWSRGQEKMAGKAEDFPQATTPSTPSFGSVAKSFTPAPQPSFGSAPLGNNTMSTTPSFGAPAFGEPVAGFGGKPAPQQPQHPEI